MVAKNTWHKNKKRNNHRYKQNEKENMFMFSKKRVWGMRHVILFPAQKYFRLGQ